MNTREKEKRKATLFLERKKKKYSILQRCIVIYVSENRSYLDHFIPSWQASWYHTLIDWSFWWEHLEDP
jgi:hypothetical protein